MEFVAALRSCGPTKVVFDAIDIKPGVNDVIHFTNSVKINRLEIGKFVPYHVFEFVLN